MTLRARLLPGRGAAPDDAVQVTVYVVTGRHGGLRIPASFCRECDLFARAADEAAEKVEADVDVAVVSWWTHVVSALRRGGYHPPVLVVDGRKVAQGENVPTVEEVADAIRDTEPADIPAAGGKR